MIYSRQGSGESPAQVVCEMWPAQVVCEMVMSHETKVTYT